MRNGSVAVTEQDLQQQQQKIMDAKNTFTYVDLS